MHMVTSQAGEFAAMVDGMQRLFIGVFGSAAITWAGTPVLKGKRKATALLAYLALTPPHRATRSTLAGLLWSDSTEARARSSLRQCLTDIRAELKGAASGVLDAGSDAVALDMGRVSLESDQVLAAMAGGSDAATPVSALDVVAAEAGGEILGGLRGISEEFDAWLGELEARLHAAILAGLTGVMERAGGTGADALRAAQQIAALDPLNEAACRVAMRELAQRGEVGAALTAYSRLCAALDDELGMDPSETTQDLAVRIKTGEVAATPAPTPASVAVAAPSPTAEVLRPPRVAIFPFLDLGPVPAHRVLLDGILEDTVSLLAQHRELRIYSSNTTRRFRGVTSGEEPRPAGLDCEYYVTGSLRSGGTHYRVTTQLVEAETGLIEWAQSYDVAQADLFEMQSDISRNVAYEVMPGVASAELRRTEGMLPADLSAYHLMIRARDIAFALDNRTFQEAHRLLAAAVDKDPRYSVARLALTDWYSVQLGQGWSADAGRDGKLLSEAAAAAVRLSGQSGRALAVYAHNLTVASGFSAESAEIVARALSHAPHDPDTLVWSTPTLTFAGDPQAGIDNAETAIALSPHDPYLFRHHHFLSIARFANGDFAEAARAGRQAMVLNPRYTSNLRMTAAALSEAGEAEAAREIVARARSIDPAFRVGAFRAKQPFRDPAIGERYAARLIEAGMPE